MARIRDLELMIQSRYPEEIRATKPLCVIRREESEALRRWARDRTVMAS